MGSDGCAFRKTWLLGCMCALLTVWPPTSTSVVSCSFDCPPAAKASPMSPFGQEPAEGDPIESFTINDPIDGAVEKLPVKFVYHVAVRNREVFQTRYNGMEYCVEINGTWKKCKPMMGTKIKYYDLPRGNYTARMYISDAEGRIRNHETAPVSFVLVGADAFETYNDLLVEQSRRKHHFPEDTSLLQWAYNARSGHSYAIEGHPDVIPASTTSVFASKSETSGLLLIIGVKTAVLTNFPRRQAIRETWANKATLPHDVKVFFLGCSPILHDLSPRDQRRFQHAVALERSVYGDLLTEELDCEDAYRLLSDKVKAFLHFGAAEFPHAKFMMLADDDSYVRVDHLVDVLLNEGQLTPSYMGESQKSVLREKEGPSRDPTNRYYLPETQYPMNEYPPFALGHQYLLSMDCVRYIAKNAWRLRSLNGLEDVSTALWLLTTQVHVRHTPSFVSLRIRPCVDRASSIAEFSSLGLRLIHKNLHHGRRLCHGYDRRAWQWQGAVSASDMLAEENGPNPGESLQLETYVRNVVNSGDHEVVTVLSTPSWAGIKTSYFPSVENLSAYSSRICAQAQRYFPDTFRGFSSCFRIAEVLHEHLRRNQRHFS